MKKIVLALLLAALAWPAASAAQTPAATAPAASAAPPAAQQPQGRKKRVAILDFDYGTVHSTVAALFGKDIDVGKASPTCS